MTDFDDPSLLAAGHALGSLTPEERAEYEAYLARSADARREATAFEAVAAALDGDVAEATPPAALKARLMAQVARTPQLAAAVTAETATAVGVPLVADSRVVSALTGAPRTSADARARARWFRRPGVILVAAAAAVALFAGGTAVGVAVDNGSSAVQHEAATLAQISAAPDARRTSRDVAGGGSATLIWSEQLGKSVVVLDGLPQAPAGKTYQLWYIGSGSVVSAGLVTTRPGERTWQVLNGRMAAGDTVGITIEPAGGSNAPTTKPIVAIAS
ncbi:MAG: anti-sigma factor [Microbacteriaceae bacterium]|nr:MAG: anti-sigma factor [Microbacteriaceae bacterium]